MKPIARPNSTHQPMLRLALAIAALFVLPLFMAGCGRQPAEEAAPTPTAEEAPPEPTAAAQAPEVQAPESEDADQACLDCHQSKERLIETADPEEPAKAASSGEG